MSGRQPLSTLAREGLQTACWQYARSNSMPARSERVDVRRLHVRRAVAAESGRRSSTAMKRTFSGFAANDGCRRTNDAKSEKTVGA